jgi:hypothetical protein
MAAEGAAVFRLLDARGTTEGVPMARWAAHWHESGLVV